MDSSVALLITALFFQEQIMEHCKDLFKKLFDTKHFKDKITRELFKDVPVDKLCNDRSIETVP